MSMFSVPVAGAASTTGSDDAAASVGGGAADVSSAGLSRDEQAASTDTANAVVSDEASDFGVIEQLRIAGAALLHGSLRQPGPEAIEPLHECSGIRQLRAFGEHRLFVKHQRKLAKFRG